MESKKYDGWIISDNILKRSFAILGHAMLAQLIIAIPFYVLMFIALFAFMPTVAPMTPGQQNSILYTNQ